MNKEEIEKEFEKYIDKMFKDRFIVDRKLFKWAGRKAFKKAVIDFWFSKLNTQKKDILENIDKIAPKTKPLGDLTGNDTKYFEFGYNQACGDIIKLLT